MKPLENSQKNGKEPVLADPAPTRSKKKKKRQ